MTALQSFLQDRFKRYRKNKEYADDIICALEGSECSRKYFSCYGMSKYPIFYNTYIIELLKAYVPGQDNYEIMLMSFGLLYGYDNIEKLTERRNLYAQKAVGNNKKISADWPKPSDNLIKIEGKLLDEMIERLEKAVLEPDGQRKPLGLADEVDRKLREQFPAGLPDQCPLPVPRFLNDAAAERLGLQTDVAEEPVEALPDDGSLKASNENATETASTEIGDAPETADDAGSTAASDVSGKEEIDGAQPEEATTQSKQIRMNLPKHKAYLLFGTLILLVAVVIFIVIKTIYPLLMSPYDNSADAKPPVDLEAVEVMVPNKVIGELIIEAQEPIAVFDDAGQYDILAMCQEIKEKIMHNPIYGDMVAQGLISTGELATERNTWLTEFVEATNAAMEDGDGMRHWITYPQGMLTISDKYTEYANKLCTLLDFYIPVGIYEMESTGNWSLGADSEGALVRARENSEQITSPALVFQYVDAGENVKATFGFCVDDGRFAIYNPALMQNWDALQITGQGEQ